MKIRTSLLVACIIVVPLIAMFSHRVPQGTRNAVAGWLRDLTRRPKPVAVSPVEAAPVAVPSTSVQPVQHAVAAPAALPRVVPVAAVAAVPPDVAAEADSVGRLRALGAIAIECRPVQGSAGHVASCRMPVDGDGQLQRVFQATGVDASSAAEKLLRDVQAWVGGSAGGPRRTMRF